jgi:aspartate kinase
VSGDASGLQNRYGVLKGSRVGSIPMRSRHASSFEYRISPGRLTAAMSVNYPPIIVQKFGGTTMHGPRAFESVKNTIAHALDEGHKVVAVVSAMGRGPDADTGSPGDPYATDTLLTLLPDDPACICLREKDLLMMCGEILSAVKLACYLRSQNIAASARTGFEAGIITDENSGNARIKTVFPERVLNDLHDIDVVVVAGFQGMSQSGKITTLGRGGSDTTAVALGKALRAERIEIYTDQSGVYSADPRDVPGARHLQIMNAKDIVHMTWAGARVLHPRAAEMIDRFQLPVRVGSVTTPEISTTIEVSDTYESVQLITAVAHGETVTQISVFHSIMGNAAFLADVFGLVSGASVSMDMFTVTDNLLQFTIDDCQTHTVVMLLEKNGYRCSTRTHCRKVSIVGAGMHKMKGVIARFSKALALAGIPILQTTDSHATISALVDAVHARKAQQVLHTEFLGG